MNFDLVKSPHTEVTPHALVFRLLSLERRHDDQRGAGKADGWGSRILEAAAAEANVARVCRRLGLSRKSFYKWKQ